ncbi:exosome non-catalytic core subunit rrp40 [Modicella reniformis]|uniref:Ribosomal RNA-processing protein 40 n=1 Tax=Modicella reniformis TaxID=1440133 RepID=A0A9P6J3V0_9FUNG|nr:exosome non-catalytic core subunit rrp40 [Modicella reniformis]
MASIKTEQPPGSLLPQGPSIVLPGDLLPAPGTRLVTDDDDAFITTSTTAPVIKLGPGLLVDDDSIGAIKAGILKHTPTGNRWWVESNQRRYVAAQGESVVGVVISKSAEHYKMDIGAAQHALLGVLSFEGASKRFKPDIKIGSLVYCRVSLANKDMEAELECFNPTTMKSDGYGELKNGFAIKTSLGLARRLLDPKTLILRLLGQHTPFETVIGMNGKIWVDSESPKKIILICNAIKNSEFLSDTECKTMVKTVIEKL